MLPVLRHIILLLTLCCASIIAFSQNPLVKASVDRDRILIGEPIQLTLEANVPLGIDVKWFPIDTLPHFEFIDKAKIDTVTTADGKTFRQLLTITSFDSGRWSIPMLQFEAAGKQFATDSIPVSVAYSEFNPDQDYHDIKDIVEVQNPYARYINWAIAALTLLSVIAVIYFLRKKPQQETKPVVKKTFPSLSPVDEAMEALRLLQQQNLLERGEIKQFYTSLNEILRQYLWRKTQMPNQEKTNNELVLQLKKLNWSNDALLQLAQQLRLADAVKFAKYTPPEAESRQAFDNIKQSIQSLDRIVQ